MGKTTKQGGVASVRPALSCPGSPGPFRHASSLVVHLVGLARGSSHVRAHIHPYVSVSLASPEFWSTSEVGGMKGKGQGRGKRRRQRMIGTDQGLV